MLARKVWLYLSGDLDFLRGCNLHKGLVKPDLNRGICKLNHNGHAKVSSPGTLIKSAYTHFVDLNLASSSFLELCCVGNFSVANRMRTLMPT